MHEYRVQHPFKCKNKQIIKYLIIDLFITIDYVCILLNHTEIPQDK